VADSFAPLTTAINGPSNRIVETASKGDGIRGADVILPGTFNPGHSPGTAFFGTLELVDTSHLIMEIAGRNAHEYDHIVVEGLLIFSGTLEVRLLDGFIPMGGDRFDFFDWGSAAGHFDDILLPALAQYLTWDLSDLYLTGEMFVRGGTDDVSARSATNELFAFDSPGANQISWSPTFLLLTAGLIATTLFRRR
jgi:hypothetical protein